MDGKSTERRPNIKSNDQSANLWLERDAANPAPHPLASLLGICIMRLIDVFHRIKLMFVLSFVLVSLFGCATQYTVTAEPSKFLLRSGDLLSEE